jgi:hypothetical protein
MSQPIRIWLEISHHAAFRVGGWAWLRADGVSLSGFAGGDRNLDAERCALAGLSAALGKSGDGRSRQLHTSSGLVAGIPDRLKAAQAGGDRPDANLDLWAQAMAAVSAAPLAIVRTHPSPGEPMAFAAHWAEFARDKAKAGGPFSAAIPKVNLSKAGVAP